MELRSRIAAAENGDMKQARRLLEEFVSAVVDSEKEGMTQTCLREPYLEYFARCFKKILAGQSEDADKALNIRPPRNRPKNEELKTRDIELAKKVALLLQGDPELQITTAYLTVADSEHVSSDTVRKAYLKHQNIAKVTLEIERRYEPPDQESGKK